MSGVQPHSTLVKSGNWIIFATVMYPNWYVIDEFESNMIPFKSLAGRFDNKS